MVLKTAAIRYELGSEHTYEFIDGAVPAAMAPGTCTAQMDTLNENPDSHAAN